MGDSQILRVPDMRLVASSLTILALSGSCLAASTASADPSALSSGPSVFGLHATAEQDRPAAVLTDRPCQGRLRGRRPGHRRAPRPHRQPRLPVDRLVRAGDGARHDRRGRRPRPPSTPTPTSRRTDAVAPTRTSRWPTRRRTRSGTAARWPPASRCRWHLSKANFPAAWDRTTGAGAQIGIIDSEFDTQHPDLQAKVRNPYNTANGTAELPHGQRAGRRHRLGRRPARHARRGHRGGVDRQRPRHLGRRLRRDVRPGPDQHELHAGRRQPGRRAVRRRPHRGARLHGHAGRRRREHVAGHDAQPRTAGGGDPGGPRHGASRSSRRRATSRSPTPTRRSTPRPTRA